MEKCCSSEQSEQTFVNMLDTLAEHFKYFVVDTLKESDWRDLFLGNNNFGIFTIKEKIPHVPLYYLLYVTHWCILFSWYNSIFYFSDERAALWQTSSFTSLSTYCLYVYIYHCLPEMNSKWNYPLLRYSVCCSYPHHFPLRLLSKLYLCFPPMNSYKVIFDSLLFLY